MQQPHLIEWEPASFGRYLARYDQTKMTPELWRELISGGIHLLFEIMYRPDRPQWISKFLIRSALSADGREYVARTVSGDIVPLLMDLYRRVSGNPDPDPARCWSLRILAAPMVFTANLTEYSRFRRGGSVNAKLYRKLEEVTIRESLFAVGLAE